MTAKLTRWLVPRIPAILVGATTGLVFNQWFRPEGGAYYMIGVALIGAVLGLWIHHDLRGLYRAMQTGAARYVAVWTIIGGLAGGMLGLLIRRFDCQAATSLPWLFGATLWTTWLRCAMIGAVLSLLQVGDHYGDATAATPKSG